MERLPWGTLTRLSKQAEIPAKYLSEIVSTEKRPSRKRALLLEQASSEIGNPIPAATWLLGSKDEIRALIFKERT